MILIYWHLSKKWQNHSDKVLSTLANNIVKRKLFKVKLLNQPLKQYEIKTIKNSICKSYDIAKEDVNYFFMKVKLPIMHIN